MVLNHNKTRFVTKRACHPLISDLFVCISPPRHLLRSRSEEISLNSDKWRGGEMEGSGRNSLAVSSSTAGNSSRLKCVWEEMMPVCRRAAAPPPCQIGPVQSSSTSVSFDLRHPLHTRFLSYLYCKVGHKHKFSFYKQTKKQWDYKLTAQFSLCDPSSVSCCVSKNHSIQRHGIDPIKPSKIMTSWYCSHKSIHFPDQVVYDTQEGRVASFGKQRQMRFWDGAFSTGLWQSRTVWALIGGGQQCTNAECILSNDHG